MILRELLAEFGMTSINEFSKRANLSRRHAWNLWHGRARIGLNLSKDIALRTGIPLARLVEVDPTPPTPNRGKGGGRRASLPSEDEIQPAPPET
jgi:hypothetical protein